MTIEKQITEKFCKAIETLYSQAIDINTVQISKTRKDIRGDFTINVFPYLKISRKSPEQTAIEIGKQLTDSLPEIDSFDVIKGFLNLVLSDSFWVQQLNNKNEPIPSRKNALIEFSSPNTNKPLHLGHIRNNLIGHSISEILKANGQTVTKVNLVNDRGIHICKSMLAWQKWGNGESPETSGMKGDHLVGKHYVEFDKKSKANVAYLFNLFKEYKKLPASFTKEQIAAQIGMFETAERISNELNYPTVKRIINSLKIIQSKQINTNQEIDFIEQVVSALIESPLYSAQEMLLKWEEGDKDIINLWNKMNGWVYEGFDITYKELGISFDKTYYESQTYGLGKDEVLKGVTAGALIKKEDNSVWADLTDEGLDEKLLLRSDGTSVYMTQDIGTAIMRKNEFNADEMIYVVGNEQNYHFQVFRLVLKKLGYEWYDKIFHLSYGMVELPEGKMKSREGTVVDADDLIEEMYATAKSISQELGKLEGHSESEIQKTIKMVGMGALKYFILKVDPKKNMVFNPKESIDFDGNTGPFIQYTHARICSIIRKAKEAGIVIPGKADDKTTITETEKSLLKIISDFDNIVVEAGEELNPAIIANYVYALVKEYNLFYHNLPILKESDKTKQDFRLLLSFVASEKIKYSMHLLGIEVPERM